MKYSKLMMVVGRRFFFRLFVLAVFLVGAISTFQNCSKVKFGGASRSTPVVVLQGGDIYSGKTGYYLHRLPAPEICPDGTDIKASIYKDDKGVFTMVRQNCQDLVAGLVLSAQDIAIVSGTEIRYLDQDFSWQESPIGKSSDESTNQTGGSPPPCAGYSAGGFCYYLNTAIWPNNNCNSQCASHGGCNLAGLRAVGDLQTVSCATVAKALSSTSNWTGLWNSAYGVGCFIDSEDSAYVDAGDLSSCEANIGGWKRVCACNQ